MPGKPPHTPIARQDAMLDRSGEGAPYEPPPFTINSSTCPNGTVRVSLEGELDVASAPELLDALDELRRKETWFVLDLRKLHFMDSTGLRAVIRVSKQVSDQGRTMRVIRGPDLVQKVFEITGADALVEFVEPDAPS
jgi:anti-sigma B factor antagonist